MSNYFCECFHTWCREPGGAVPGRWLLDCTDVGAVPGRSPKPNRDKDEAVALLPRLLIIGRTGVSAVAGRFRSCDLDNSDVAGPFLSGPCSAPDLSPNGIVLPRSVFGSLLLRVLEVDCADFGLATADLGLSPNAVPALSRTDKQDPSTSTMPQSGASPKFASPVVVRGRSATTCPLTNIRKISAGGGAATAVTLSPTCNLPGCQVFARPPRRGRIISLWPLSAQRPL